MIPGISHILWRKKNVDPGMNRLSTLFKYTTSISVLSVSLSRNIEKRRCENLAVGKMTSIVHTRKLWKFYFAYCILNLSAILEIFKVWVIKSGLKME